MKANKITKENIKIFVIEFYSKVMQDEEVGPFFIAILGEDMKNKTWSEHMELLCDFWATMTLENERNYIGSPFAPHIKLQGLRKETFYRWLEIFHETLDDLYEEKQTLIFKKTGQIMALNFMRNLGL